MGTQTNLERWRAFTADFESPDLFIDWSFYSLVSSALQRRVWIGSDPITGLPTQNSIFLNQFIVLIGPPSCGKSRPICNVKAICEHESNKRSITIKTASRNEVFATAAITCTPDNITFEGLFEFLAKPDRIDAIILKNREGKEVPYAHNSASACLEELGVMFTKNAEDVASVLCQAYDSRNLFRWTKTQGKDQISNVCVNFLAGTTTDALRRMLCSSQSVTEGLSSRIIFVYAPKPRFFRDSWNIRVEQQEACNALIKRINFLATQIKGEITFTPECTEFMREYYESGKLVQSERVNHDKNLDYYYGRKKLHWKKLSGVIHLADHDDLVVGIESAQAALKVFHATEVNMHLTFQATGKNDLAEIASQVLSYLKNNGETSYKKLLFTFFKDGSKIEFDEVLTFLTTTEQITASGGGYRYNEKQPNYGETTK